MAQHEKKKLMGIAFYHICLKHNLIIAFDIHSYITRNADKIYDNQSCYKALVHNE